MITTIMWINEPLDVRSAKNLVHHDTRLKCKQVDDLQVPIETGQIVRRSECPLLSCYIRHNFSMETSRNSVNCKVRQLDHDLVKSVRWRIYIYMVKLRKLC